MCLPTVLSPKLLSKSSNFLCTASYNLFDMSEATVDLKTQFYLTNGAVFKPAESIPIFLYKKNTFQPLYQQVSHSVRYCLKSSCL
jgi:hypothetical protein